MAAQSRPDPHTLPHPVDEGVPPISACQTSPGQVVFLESRNSDGWIATDHVVDTSP